MLSRANREQITWSDLPDDEAVAEGLGRGARFAVAWLNNFSLELDAAQQVSMATFLSGAPWARRFFHPVARPAGPQEGRPSIRASEELTIKASIDAYLETLLQWLHQLSGNTGSGFSQELFNADLLLQQSQL